MAGAFWTYPPSVLRNSYEKAEEDSWVLSSVLSTPWAGKENSIVLFALGVKHCITDYLQICLWRPWLDPCGNLCMIYLGHGIFQWELGGHVISEPSDSLM